MPAVSDDAAKAMRREIRRWRLNLRSDKTLADLARMFNRVVQGWINYYGRFYKSRLYPRLPAHQRVSGALGQAEIQTVAAATPDAARSWLASVARREPKLFAHWQLGVRPDGWMMGAV